MRHLPPEAGTAGPAPTSAVVTPELRETLGTPHALLLEEQRRREKHGDVIGSLSEFCKQAWHLIEEVPLVWNWHLDVICEVLQRCADGDPAYRRCIINISPGTGKSILMVMWTAWWWGQRPELRWLTTSYSTALATRDSQKVLDIVRSSWYQERFPLRLRSSQPAVSTFATTRNGNHISSSVRGAGTGLHFSALIVDDPHKESEARSDVERGRALNWFSRTASIRGVNQQARVVVVMQRLHEEDLTGYLLESGGNWYHLCLPMRYEPGRADASPLDPRTEDGELMFPALFDEATVAQMELDLGIYATAGQLQQRPGVESEGLFPIDAFEMVDAPPLEAQRVRAWDCAATKDGGDWTAGVKMSRTKDGYFWVEDCRRGRLSVAGVDQLIAHTAALDGVECAIREEEEGGASGKFVTESRLQMLAGFDYKGVRPTGDKIVRSAPFRSMLEGGRVKMVKGNWNKALLSELAVFPVGKFDDQVDSCSLAFLSLTSGLRPLRVVRSRWR